MSAGIEERVRERAHAIWIEEGCPEGRDQEHWLRAEQEMGAVITVPAKAPARKPSARKPSVKAAAAAPQAAARKPRARKAAVTA